MRDRSGTHDSTVKLPWDAPVTVALTDTDSRADNPDVALRNGGSSTSLP